jgi:uncharacterized membrane protein
MDGPRWIVAAVGLLGLWVLATTIRGVAKGEVRRRDGKAYLRAIEPRKFWEAAILNAVVSTIFIALAVGVIVFDFPLAKYRGITPTAVSDRE